MTLWADDEEESDKAEASFSESGLLGGVGSLREGTSASSSEGNGIGEPGRGTEWVAGKRGE